MAIYYEISLDVHDRMTQRLFITKYLMIDHNLTSEIKEPA